MTDRESEFRKRLLSTFKAEALDHISTISAGLSELERMPPVEVQMEIVETVFRESHSLKGAARAVNIADIETVCQSLESVFASWKARKVNQSRELYDALYLAIDTIRAFVAAIEGGAAVEKEHIGKLIKELGQFASGGPAVRILGDRIDLHPKPPAAQKEEAPEQAKSQDENKEPAPLQPGPSAEDLPFAFKAPFKFQFQKEWPGFSDTIRVSTDKLGSLLLQAEEMVPFKLTAYRQTDGIKDIASGIGQLSVELAKAGREIFSPEHGAAPDKSASHRLQEFFNWAQTHLKAVESMAAELARTSKQNNRALDRLATGLLEDMKKTMMLPFSTLLEGFPMLVRDISREEGKEADLLINGEGIEMDRRILEEMKDPLIHLVRNAIGHGIERPEARDSSGKSRRGTVTITVAHLGGNRAEILVSDDGCGIDPAKVREAAVKNGVLSKEESEGLDDREALMLIFSSGISTSPIITDISGRGLGLAIVIEKAEKLGGTVEVSSTLKKGTAFRIVLPLTIATFRGVLVEASAQPFIVPTSHVESVARVRKDSIKTVENRETVEIGGEPLSFVRLQSVLELAPVSKRHEEAGYSTVLVIGSGERRIAFEVDGMFGECEVLVKSLGSQLQRVRNVSGAAILGSGKPVPILNVSDLMRSAVRSRTAPLQAPAAAEEAKEKSILVVEDSITSRMLLKSILDGAGYSVKTAVDGIDAITMLRTEEFDLVVSDIEMPRMDGFDLTVKIRSDKRLSDMPVVLVTALESREDRERGIEAGANAYIVKSSFNQSNLLEVIRRLI